MRKCLRCHEEMVENLDVKVDMQGYGIIINKSIDYKWGIKGWRSSTINKRTCKIIAYKCIDCSKIL